MVGFGLFSRRGSLVVCVVVAVLGTMFATALPAGAQVCDTHGRLVSPAPAMPDSSCGTACGVPVPSAGVMASSVGASIESILVRLDAVEARLDALAPVASAPVAAASPVVSRSVVVASSPVVVSSSYVGRWSNNDGLSRRDHAVHAHGFDASLSDAELARQHDAYHDTYGGANPASYNGRTSSRTVTRSVGVSSAGYSNCPGGNCPNPNMQPRGGGWYFGKALGF